MTASLASMSDTVSAQEINRFQKTASLWWRDDGPYRLLHELNPVRVRYIQEACAQHIVLKSSSSPLKILDMGCGGGLLSVPFARQGHDVTGIDACEDNIHIAKAYAAAQNLELVYHAVDGVTFAAQHSKPLFDVVLMMEILEHIPQPALLIEAAVSLLKPGGLLFFSTINRSWLSRLLVIGAAEDLLRWIPKGTHQWQSFLRPAEVIDMITTHHIQPVDLTGVMYRPLHHQWVLHPSRLAMNYMGYGLKPS